MRHRKRKHKLGASGPHRSAMMGNLSAALITHARIETTLSKARALRPFVEKIITLAKKAEKSKDAASKLHLRRLAIARVRDKAAVSKLFDVLVGEFTERNGGYTRIYKLGQRIGDAAEMALIELIDGSDEGYVKKSNKKTVKKASTKNDDKGQSETSKDKPEANDSEDKSEKALKEAILNAAEIQESETSEINKAAEFAEESEEAPVEELKKSLNKDAVDIDKDSSEEPKNTLN
ncbi:MAG: 50S ribosomal protein L17 [Verrucomicrobiota bacterium]|nr:50S ribosomal protein L17 [Verrucomicrobiota bacterium]